MAANAGQAVHGVDGSVVNLGTGRRRGGAEDRTGSGLAMRSRIDGGDDIRVAVAARLFRDRAVVGFDLERVGESAGRKCQRMPEAVGRFGDILADDMMRHVTVGAAGGYPVARAL